MSDQAILNNPKQLAASLALTHWLQCKFSISTANVIGHNESLSSPYHLEKIVSMQTQTHQDWNKADMDIYRTDLAALGSCSSSGSTGNTGGT
jgi:beta-N-acetylhexosaminidase